MAETWREELRTGLLEALSDYQRGQIEAERAWRRLEDTPTWNIIARVQHERAAGEATKMREAAKDRAMLVLAKAMDMLDDANSTLDFMFSQLQKAQAETAGAWLAAEIAQSRSPFDADRPDDCPAFCRYDLILEARAECTRLADEVESWKRIAANRLVVIDQWKKAAVAGTREFDKLRCDFRAMQARVERWVAVGSKVRKMAGLAKVMLEHDPFTAANAGARMAEYVLWSEVTSRTDELLDEWEHYVEGGGG